MSAISIANATISQPSSTNSTASAKLQAYFKERRAEVQQLKEALESGDLGAAQQAYDKIVALGNNVLHRDNPYLRSDRGLDFNAIGGAIENGDLSGARQAFAALQGTYGHKLPPASLSPATVVNLSRPSGSSL